MNKTSKTNPSLGSGTPAPMEAGQGVGPMHPLAALDLAHVWHPFTQMRDWMRQEPVVIVRGEGPYIEDVHGKRYLDANASIWTNLHGHCHPKLNGAIQAQLGKIAHSSALGLANEPASVLAGRLVEAAKPLPGGAGATGGGKLTKVFFSDDGSTAMEVALKLAFESARRTGLSAHPRFLSLEGGYHGDTVGAVSAGHIPLFHQTYAPLLFKVDSIPAPYCYRCRFNRAQPQRADARTYRKCRWECVAAVERKFERRARTDEPYAGMIFEPRMQGAAGMIPQPEGWLRRVTGAARAHGTPLIADEIMTGFGRTGGPDGALFACKAEGIEPDFLSVAKGLTGGYLPMAATLTTEKVFEAFLGDYAEFKSFFHGHSYTGNQLGAAVGLASLDLLQTPEAISARAALEQSFTQLLARLWDRPQVGDIRQAGLVMGIELVRDWRTREAIDLSEKAGIRVCEAMTRRGVITRPIGNVIALIPPYCVTPAQAETIVDALDKAIGEVLG